MWEINKTLNNINDNLRANKGVLRLYHDEKDTWRGIEERPR